MTRKPAKRVPGMTLAPLYNSIHQIDLDGVRHMVLSVEVTEPCPASSDRVGRTNALCRCLESIRNLAGQQLDMCARTAEHRP